MATAPPTITCPRCQKKFKGKPELFGKRIKCPGCTKPFVVPSPDAKINEEELKNVFDLADEPEATEDAGVKEAIKVPAAKRFFEDDDGPAQYDVTAEDLTPRCPNCANEMESADAVVCLYCGYNTSTRTWGTTKKTIESTGGDRFLWLLPGLICALVVFLQLIFCLYFCLVLPAQLGDNWRWLSHESMKMWAVIFNLFLMWPLGFIAYRRLVINPDPPEKEAN